MPWLLPKWNMLLSVCLMAAMMELMQGRRHLEHLTADVLCDVHYAV